MDLFGGTTGGAPGPRLPPDHGLLCLTNRSNSAIMRENNTHYVGVYHPCLGYRSMKGLEQGADDERTRIEL